MDENILSRLPLNKTIALGRIEPLHHTLFSSQRVHSLFQSPAQPCSLRQSDFQPPRHARLLRPRDSGTNQDWCLALPAGLGCTERPSASKNQAKKSGSNKPS